MAKNGASKIARRFQWIFSMLIRRDKTNPPNSNNGAATATCFDNNANTNAISEAAYALLYTLLWSCNAVTKHAQETNSKNRHNCSLRPEIQAVDSTLMGCTQKINAAQNAVAVGTPINPNNR